MLSGIHSALHPVPFRHFISVRTCLDVDECGSHCMKVGRNPKFLLHLLTSFVKAVKQLTIRSPSLSSPLAESADRKH